MHVAVVGGGIVGVSAAAFLAEGGAQVALAEQTEHVAAQDQAIPPELDAARFSKGV